MAWIRLNFSMGCSASMRRLIPGACTCIQTREIPSSGFFADLRSDCVVYGGSTGGHSDVAIPNRIEGGSWLGLKPVLSREPGLQLLPAEAGQTAAVHHPHTPPQLAAFQVPFTGRSWVTLEGPQPLYFER